jgi:hypothetical protein
MEEKDIIKQTVIIAVIMADNIAKPLYERMEPTGAGYKTTVELISKWAIEFQADHKDTDWEDLIYRGLQPISKEMDSVFCWEDCVADYAYYKLATLEQELKTFT